MRLREHQQSAHDGFKPHQCDVCGRTFHRLSNMVREKWYLLIPHYCIIEFCVNNNLFLSKRVHRKKHFGYNCEHCGEIFEHLRTLTEHINAVHDVEPSPKRVAKKPQPNDCFVCRFCGRKLTTHQSLLDHEHIHTGEKPHSCKTCGKTFRWDIATRGLLEIVAVIMGFYCTEVSQRGGLTCSVMLKELIFASIAESPSGKIFR